MSNNVELWPAEHSVIYESHGQLIEYLKNIPTGSVFIMETSPQLASFLRQAVALQLGKQVMKKELPGRYSKPDEFFSALFDYLNKKSDRILNDISPAYIPNILAIMEILTICKQKKIMVFPVDIEMGKADDVQKSYTSLEFIERRERIFSDKIKKVMNFVGNRRVIFFSGADHSEAVLKNLVADGINARINFDMYNDVQKYRIERTILENRLRRLANKQGQQFDYVRFEKQYPKRDSVRGADGRIVDYLSRVQFPNRSKIVKQFLRAQSYTHFTKPETLKQLRPVQRRSLLKPKLRV